MAAVPKDISFIETVASSEGLSENGSPAHAAQPFLMQWFLQSGLSPSMRAEGHPNSESDRYNPLSTVFVPELLSWLCAGPASSSVPPPSGIQALCFPAGVRLVSSHEACGPLPTYFTFVSTGNLGDKLFGHCLTVYSPVSDKQAARLTGHSTAVEADAPPQQLFAPLCYTILSKRLYVEAEDLLYKLHSAHLSHSELTRALPPLRLDCAQPSPPLSATAPSSFDARISEHGCEQCGAIMARVVSVPEPASGRSVRIPVGTGHVDIETTVQGSPLDPADIPYADVFQALSVSNVLAVWTAGLLEWQIVLHSSQLSLLHKTTQVLQSLLYPFQWMHTLIPVLPHDCAGSMG